MHQDTYEIVSITKDESMVVMSGYAIQLYIEQEAIDTLSIWNQQRCYLCSLYMNADSHNKSVTLINILASSHFLWDVDSFSLKDIIISCYM